ncbi:MAG: hypothetical protein KAT06_09860 [Gammaproteobacteria bacterium]|nr:hypothetical protein [Gammaproteobacteria bacterium]
MPIDLLPSYMNYKKIKIQIFILCLSIILPITLVSATQKSKNKILDFSLDIQNTSEYFQFPSYTYKTKSEQLGISWYESFTEYFHGGLELGYINMTQIDNNLTSAKFTSGQYAGLLLRFIPINAELFSLTLNANYRYNDTQGTSSNQESRFIWNETLLTTELKFQPTSLIGLTFAAEYHLIDGSQQDSGTINQITAFNAEKQYGTHFGLNFTTHRTGIVGFEWFTGFRNGSRLYFSREF